MDFSTYQSESRKNTVYPDIGNNFIFPTLGLVGEAGEIAEKVKKLIRDKNTNTPDMVRADDKTEIAKELGDVLWYLSQLATEFGIELDTIAALNLDKIQSRRERDQVKGNGDNR